MKTSIQMLSQDFSQFRSVLEQGEDRGTHEGRQSSALFSILYLYESEGVVREKCRGVGILLGIVDASSACS